MSEKGKKGKKEKGSTGSEEDSLNASEKHLLDEVTKEVYESKVRELTEKLSRFKHKADTLKQENEELGVLQAKFTQDRQDIVEFLNIKVQEYERQISALEDSIRKLEKDKSESEAESKQTLEKHIEDSKQEIDHLSIQCAKYKHELDQLAEFRGKKDDMEHQIKHLNALLEQKEREYKDIIHTMERKILQDKNLMKKEMLQKVNEAVANFRRVADQQMAETTKRAIRENMAITTQLKKMSTKTIDLIAENEVLNKKVAKLKTTNSLLVESEKELAKKNQANQRVIKLLVEKLKESDEMLEAAYEKGALEDNSGAIFQPTFKMDFFGAGGGGGGGNNVHQEEENERRSSNAHAEEEMEELKDELESYKQNAGRLSGHLFDFQSISEEVSKILTSVAEGERQNEAGKAYVKTLVERLSSLKQISQDPHSTVKAPTSKKIFQSAMPGITKIRNSVEMSKPSQFSKQSAFAATVSSRARKEGANISAAGSRGGANLMSIISHIPSKVMHFVDENDDENRLREMEEHDGDNGSGSGGEDEFDAFGSGGGGAQDYREAYSLPLPKARGFSIGKEPIKPITPDNTSSHPHGLKDIAIQTLPLPFSREQVDASHLLTELRPWGPAAQSMMKKKGMYFPRADAEQPSSKEYYRPHIPTN